MKRILFTIFSLTLFTLTAIAQPRLSSNKSMHNFGQIEWKQPVTAEYVITNTGDKPLVLSNITTSCACTDATWTKSPIAPGEKGTISVTFDAEALGRFEKSVGIYSNSDPSLVYLKFGGEVVQEITDFTNSHPYEIGQIKIDRTEFDFPDVQRGETSTITFSVVNQSDRPYEPVLMHLPRYLTMEKTPNVLQKGQKGTIKLTLDSEQLLDFGLTQSSVYLARFAGDKVGEENEIPVSAVLLPSFNELTVKDKANAPIIKLSASDIDFSSQLAKKNKASQDITITNTGKSTLVIGKLQVFNPALSVNLKKTSLQPGESTRLRVTINKNNPGKKKQHMRILMITNDPSQPKVTINVKR